MCLLIPVGSIGPHTAFGQESAVAVAGVASYYQGLPRGRIGPEAPVGNVIVAKTHGIGSRPAGTVPYSSGIAKAVGCHIRAAERRVGQECGSTRGSRWSPYHSKK